MEALTMADILGISLPAALVISTWIISKTIEQMHGCFQDFTIRVKLETGQEE